MPKKMVFLYVGKLPNGASYLDYPDNALTALGGTTGKANEFVIAGGNYANYFNNATELNTFLNSVANLAVRVYNKTGKKVWLGLPRAPVPTSTMTLSQYQTYASKLRDCAATLRDKINGLSANFLNNYVNGFCMNDEHVRNTPAGADDQFGVTVNYNNLTAHPQIYMYDNVSKYVKNILSKQLIWCPYYGAGNVYASTIKDIQYISNRTNIFNYVFIQPQYYFRGQNVNDAIGLNLKAIRESMRLQRVVSRNASHQIVDNVSKGAGINTVIGCQMEIDSQYSQPAFAARYNDQKSIFETPLTNPSHNPPYSKANGDFSFYCGAYQAAYVGVVRHPGAARLDTYGGRIGHLWAAKLDISVGEIGH